MKTDTQNVSFTYLQGGHLTFIISFNKIKSSLSHRCSAIVSLETIETLTEMNNHAMEMKLVPLKVLRAVVA